MTGGEKSYSPSIPTARQLMPVRWFKFQRIKTNSKKEPEKAPSALIREINDWGFYSSYGKNQSLGRA
jgi:hypothetical protein